MPSSTDVTGAATTAITQAWGFGLGILAVLVVYVIATGALKGAIVSIVRHTRSLFHL